MLESYAPELEFSGVFPFYIISLNAPECFYRLLSMSDSIERFVGDTLKLNFSAF